VPVTAGALSRMQPGGTVEYYTCPMPEHITVHEAAPGKCPLCRMTLIPVMSQPPPPAEPVPPASVVELPPVLYTCPMAKDADVVSDKPGICPKCDMKLVPTTEVKHRKLAEENWVKQHQH